MFQANKKVAKSKAYSIATKENALQMRGAITFIKMNIRYEKRY